MNFDWSVTFSDKSMQFGTKFQNSLPWCYNVIGIFPNFSNSFFQLSRALKTFPIRPSYTFLLLNPESDDLKGCSLENWKATDPCEWNVSQMSPTDTAGWCWLYGMRLRLAQNSVYSWSEALRKPGGAPFHCMNRARWNHQRTIVVA